MLKSLLSKHIFGKFAVSHFHVNKWYALFGGYVVNQHPFTPQWGAEDAEIKVPSDENIELKGSPFKA